VDAYYVKVEPVTKENLSRNLELVGTITANNDIAVVSESNGKVEDVNFKVGDYVSAGSLLYRLDDELKESAYRTSEVNYEKSKKDFERFEALYKTSLLLMPSMKDQDWHIFQQSRSMYPQKDNMKIQGSKHLSQA
jgi:multidrug efflux pump subunit AcrA (membrane-fusion protein)